MVCCITLLREVFLILQTNLRSAAVLCYFLLPTPAIQCHLSAILILLIPSERDNIANFDTCFYCHGLSVVFVTDKRISINC